MADLQKASMWKRISAFLFDIILLSILTVGFAFIVSAVTGYDSYSLKLDAMRAEYESEYGIRFDITEEEYTALTPEEALKYEEASEALGADAAFIKVYSVTVNLTLVITSISLLLAFMSLEFAVPLFMKNGQTLGKKIFGICLMRTDGVKISPAVLLIRTLLGKYTIETMIPAFIVIMIYFGFMGLGGTVLLLLLLLLQIIVLAATRTNSLLHDLLAGTVAVDMASQMIFDSEAELIEYKKKEAAEKAARETY